MLLLVTSAIWEELITFTKEEREGEREEKKRKIPVSVTLDKTCKLSVP